MHWTYEREKYDGEHLFQGDILARTDELEQLLRHVHPHFTDPKYSRFMVLTQSCDLVRRNGDCKASYLTIAVVRDAMAAVDAELRHLVLSRDGQGLCEAAFVTDKLQPRFQQVAESLLNNNLADYFFLFADTDAGIEKHMCAFLRVSIALRSEHYDLLLAAKCAQLREVFQAKLGWLVGYNYARVGTPDWAQDPDRFKELLRSVVGDACEWVPHERFKAIRKALVEDDDETAERVRELLGNDEIMPKPRKELFLDAVRAAWGDGPTPPEREKFLNKLQSQRAFKLASQ